MAGRTFVGVPVSMVVIIAQRANAWKGRFAYVMGTQRLSLSDAVRRELGVRAVYVAGDFPAKY